MKTISTFKVVLVISASFALTATAQPACVSPPSGLVGWWRGEGNGNDSAGTNNAYAMPHVSFTNGIVGQAFSFDPENLPFGTYSGVQIADQPAYALTNSLSIEAWIRPRGDGYYIFYRGDNRSGLDPYQMSMGLNNIVSFAITDASGNSVGVSAPLVYNQWWHVAGTLDGASGNLSLYTNGSFAAQITTTVRPFGALIPGDSPGIGIGNVNDGFNNFPFRGDIDEISLYNRALSAAEIQAIYNAGSAGKCTIPVPPVTTVPTNLTVCEGSPAIFSVATTGGGLSYQWQVSGDGGITFTNLSGTATNASYTNMAPALANNGNLYKVVATGGGVSVTSAPPSLLTVNAPATASAGGNQTISGTNCVSLNSSVGGCATGGVWTSSGSGMFLPDATTVNATYCPSTADEAKGTVTLTLASTGPCAPCTNATAQVVVTLQAPPAIGNAPTNLTVCAGSPAVFSVGATGGGITYQWQLSQDGGNSFTNISGSTTNASYANTAPTVADDGNQYQVVISASGGSVTSSPPAVLTVNAPATASAGGNQTICASNATTGLGGTVGGGATGGTWTSSGTGSFLPDATTLNASYTPSAADIAAGRVTLTLTTRGQLVPCAAATAQVVVTITPPPAITSQPTNLIVCAGTPAIFSVAATGMGLTYQWQVSQDGGVTFTNISDTATNANYTNIAPALFDDFNLYQVIVSGACSPVVTSTPPAQLSVNLRPTANAGMVLPVCASSPSAQLQGLVAPVGTIGTWSGAGTFAPNATTLNAIYTPTAAEIALGTATVTLTATSQQGQCAPESSTTTITITPSATVSAGPNQSVCASGPATQLAGSFGGPVTLAWWTGAGRFEPSRYVLNPVYTPTAAEIAAGMATVTLTTDAPSWPCEAVSASMTITIIPVAAASAGGDQTICSDSSTVGLGGSVGASATGGLWTSSGTGTFTPNLATLNATYAPSAADITAGTVTLTLTAQPCSAGAAHVVVTIKPAATASAGGNQTICAGMSTSALGGTVGGSATGGLWTSSGTGTFAPDTTTLNATYTPSAGDTAAGTVTLTLSSAGQQSPCGPATAQVVVTVYPAALGTSSLLEGPGAGSDSVVLAVNPATATWTAAANAAWLHLSVANQSGTGSTNVVFSYDANLGGPRTGTLTIACQTLTVTQAGSTYVAAPGPVTALVASGLSAPYGVAVDGAGNVFVCDSGHNAIKEWTVANNTVTTLVSSGLNGPNGVAVDGAGNVYIADTHNNAIKEWMPANNTVTTLVAAGLNQPWGIAVDGAGNVYIADYGNNAIKQWTAANSNVTTLRFRIEPAPRRGGGWRGQCLYCSGQSDQEMDRG